MFKGDLPGEWLKPKGISLMDILGVPAWASHHTLVNYYMLQVGCNHSSAFGPSALVAVL